MTNIKSKILIAMMATAAIVASPAVAQTRPVQSCCDPALATMDLRTMFSLDLLPGGNLTSNYGVKFTPTAAYQTALDNTAFMAAVMGGISVASGSMKSPAEAPVSTLPCRCNLRLRLRRSKLEATRHVRILPGDVDR